MPNFQDSAAAEQKHMDNSSGNRSSGKNLSTYIQSIEDLLLIRFMKVLHMQVQHIAFTAGMDTWHWSPLLCGSNV